MLEKEETVQDIKRALYKKVLYSMMMPDLYEPPRISTPFQNAWTAIAKTWSVSQLTMGAAGGSNSPMGSNEAFVALFPDLLRNAVIYDPNVNAVAWNYQAYGSSFGTAFSPQTPATSWSMNVSTVDGENTPVHIVWFQPTLAYAPHGNKLYVGGRRGDDRRYFWMNKNDTLTMQVVGGTSTTCVVSLDLYSPSGVTEGYTAASFAIVALTSHTFSLTVSNAGYFALNVQTLVSVDLSVQGINMFGTSSVFRHVANPNISSNDGAVGAWSKVSNAVQITNTSSLTNASGYLTFDQIAGGIDWQQWPGNYNNFAATNTSQTFPFVNGCDIYYKPQNSDQFNLTPSTVIVNGAMVDGYWDMEKQLSYLLVYIQSIGSTNTFFAKLSGGLNYTTTDLFREVESGEINQADYFDALGLLQKAPQYFENPTHVEKILSFVEKAVSLATDIIPIGELVAEVA